MYTLACKDLGAPECGYVAQADSAEGAVQQMMQHAQQAHPDKIKEMAEKGMSADKIAEMMKSKVKSE